MCGLTGFWGPPAPREELERVALGMAAALERRGPDDQGAWADPARGLALAHRRLAILDLSASGHQPMHLGARYTLVFNGEIYNFAELRAELLARGATFRGHADTEVLLHALATYGVPETLGRLVGMFAFAFFDAEEGALWLARDRMGIKPLYWGTVGERLYFGSELKALRRHPALRPELDTEALTDFFRHNYIPAPRSIYRGLGKLEPGRYVRITGPGAHEQGTYWDAREVAWTASRDPLPMGPEEAADELAVRLGRAVEDRMIADVPLGAFLSGGIDSSLIVALMQERSTRPVKTFTIGFEEATHDEAIHARQVAAHLGTEHHERIVTAAEAQAVIPDLASHWDEPFSDSSQIPTTVVSAFAREQVTVCLSGDGGDELFGGYPRYFLTERLRRKMRRVPGLLRRGVAGALEAVPAGAWDGLGWRGSFLGRRGGGKGWAGYRVQRLAGLLRLGTGAALYRSMVSHWHHPAELVRGGVEPPSLLLDPRVVERLPLGLERSMLLDTVTYLPDDILCKVDRASMAASLEARVPLIDHRVFDFAWRLPQDVRVGPEPGKGLLRRLLARHVPTALFERPKMGFGVPIGAWLRGPLRPWAEELLSERRLEEGGVLDPRPIRKRFEQHLRGELSFGYLLWDVCMFQAWRERWMP